MEFPVEVAPGIFVVTSRKMLTNTTMVIAEQQALLIDPCWTPDELDAIAKFLCDQGVTVIGGFATHAHYDHLLWHPDFGEAPRWASPRTAELAETERETLITQLGTDFSNELVDLMGRVQAVPDTLPADSIPGGFEIELIIHDGHAPGHTALWLPQQQVLIAGDMLSDTELPLPFCPDDLPSYIEALHLLEPFAAEAQLVIPGHGTIGTDAVARLKKDRRYINEVLENGHSNDPRIANLGMQEEYEHLQSIVSSQRS